MTLLTFAEKFGWVVTLVFIVVIAFRDKILPFWFQGTRERQKRAWDIEDEDRKSVIVVYEKFISQQLETLKFIAQATESIRSMEQAFTINMREITRALDSNTQALFQFQEHIEKIEKLVIEGSKCPLPDCQFIDLKNGGEAIGGQDVK